MPRPTPVVIVGVFVIVLAPMQPLMAACGGAPQITSRSLLDGSATPIWSQGQDQWADDYTGGSNPPNCFTYGCYQPPLSANAQGFFWSLGTGNQALGPGDDNGTYSFGPGQGDASVWVDINYFNSGTYFWAADISGNWNLAGDGCVFNQGPTTGIDGTECTCLLLLDVDEDDSYFALMSNTLDGIGNTSFYIDGSPMTLEAFPKPVITGSFRRIPTSDVELTVRVDPPTAGLYEQNGCACGPVAYRILSQTTPRFGPPLTPQDRTSGWTELTLIGGGSQPNTPLGAEVNLEASCGAFDVDLWLAAELIFDSGYETGVVSGNGTRVECGPNIANPEALNRRPIELPNRGSQGKRRGR